MLRSIPGHARKIPCWEWSTKTKQGSGDRPRKLNGSLPLRSSGEPSVRFPANSGHWLSVTEPADAAAGPMQRLSRQSEP
jgi:hypothetical protein